MTKLYITIEEDNKKVERVLEINNATVLPTEHTDLNIIVNEMIDSLIVKPL